MERCAGSLRNPNFASLRTGRAIGLHAGAESWWMLRAENSDQQVGTFNVPESRMVTV